MVHTPPPMPPSQPAPSELPEYASHCYAQALQLILPFWGARPDTPRSFARRAALVILQATAAHADLMLGLVCLRTAYNSVPEHSLKSAILIACLSRHLGLPDLLIRDIILCALLHHQGQETRGALSRNKGYLVQRSLMNFLTCQHPHLSHYRQLLAAFQHDLGMDCSGEPRLEFSIRPSILPLLLGLCNDFIEGLCGGPPNHPNPHPTSPFRALQHLRAQPASKYHPLLLDLLQHTLGPAPVGSVVELPNQQQAIVLRSFIQDQSWQLRLLVLGAKPRTVELSSTPSQPQSPPVYLDPQPVLVLAA